VYTTQGTSFAREWDASKLLVADVNGGGSIINGFSPLKGDAEAH
jgi:hypothetical protein